MGVVFVSVVCVSTTDIVISQTELEKLADTFDKDRNEFLDLSEITPMTDAEMIDYEV